MSNMLCVSALALATAGGCSGLSVRAGKLTAPAKLDIALVDAPALPSYKRTNEEVVASWPKVADATSYELCYDITANENRTPGSGDDFVQKTDIRNMCVTTTRTTYTGPALTSEVYGWNMNVANARVRALPKDSTGEASDFTVGKVGDKAPEGVKPVCGDEAAVPEDNLNPVSAPVLYSQSSDENMNLSLEFAWEITEDYLKQAKENNKLASVDNMVFEVCAGYIQEHDPATNVTSSLECTIVPAKDAKNTNAENPNAYKYNQAVKLDMMKFQALVMSVRAVPVCVEAKEGLEFGSDVRAARIYVVDQAPTPGLQADNLNDLPSNINMVAYLALSARTLPNSWFGYVPERLVTVTTYALDYSNTPNHGFLVRVGPQGEMRVGNVTCLVADGGVAEGNALITKECSDTRFSGEGNATKWVVDIAAGTTSIKITDGAKELCLGFTKTQSKYEAPLTLMKCDPNDGGQKFAFKDTTYEPPAAPTATDVAVATGPAVDTAAPATEAA